MSLKLNVTISTHSKLNPKKTPPNPKIPTTALSLFDAATNHPSYTHHHTPPIYLHLLRRLITTNPSSLSPHVSRLVLLIQSQRLLCPEDVPLSIIKAYSKQHLVRPAFDVFDRIHDIFGCYPGVRSFNSMLNCYVGASMWDQAECFFIKWFKNEEGGGGVEPNLETYNVLIKISCRKGRFLEAMKLLGWMWDHGFCPDVYDYGTLINGLVKCGELKDARKVFDEMSERRVPLDVACFNCLIDGYLKCGFVDDAKGIFRRLVSDSKVYPNVVTYNVMINGLCKCGRVSEALEFWRRMRVNELVWKREG